MTNSHEGGTGIPSPDSKPQRGERISPNRPNAKPAQGQHSANAHTVGDIVRKSAEYLRVKGVDSCRLDAELLLAHVLECDRLKLYLNWDRRLDESDTQRMRELLQRRGQQREPLARIVGQREFYGRPFHIGKEAFVPRPETEWLVERALQLLEKFKSTMGDSLAAEKAKPPSGVLASSESVSQSPSNSDAAADLEPVSVLRPTLRPLPPGPRVVDLGTGTGCIAISIALECPEAVVFATELSEEALQTARDNASALGAAHRVRFHRGDLFAGLDGPFDLVVSNPPYIASGAIAELMLEVATHDPKRALDGGATGLDFYARISEGTPARLRPGGHLLLEIGEGQGTDVVALLREGGAFQSVHVEKDLAGLERYVEATRSPEEA